MTTANTSISTEDYQNIMKFFYDFKDENIEKRSDALAWFFLNLELVFQFPVYILMGNMEQSDPNLTADQRTLNPTIDILDIEDGQGGMLQAYALRTYSKSRSRSPIRVITLPYGLNAQNLQLTQFFLDLTQNHGSKGNEKYFFPNVL